MNIKFSTLLLCVAAPFGHTQSNNVVTAHIDDSEVSVHHSHKVDLQPSSSAINRNLSNQSCNDSEPYSFFSLESSKKIEGKSVCLQAGPNNNVIFRPCKSSVISQFWRVDCNNRFHNKRNDEKCLKKSGETLRFLKCNDAEFPGTTCLVLNQFNGQFSPCTPQKRKRASSSQSWSIQYQNGSELKFIGKPCNRYSDTGFCQECQGHCSCDSDCEGSLRCATRDAFHGRELVPGCQWGLDFFRFKDDDYCFQPTTLNGEVNYIGECGNDYKCGLCEGGCNRDKDCDGDLKCYKRSGYTHVPGCKNHGNPRDMYGKNICYDPKGLPKIEDVGSCSQTNGCDECQGNCESDDDCDGQLRCVERKPNLRVPGCSFIGTGLYASDKNFCFDPINFPIATGKVTYVGECDGDGKYRCQRCQGNCRDESDCAEGLTCLRRHGFENVPGCNGEGDFLDVKGKNICYDKSRNPELHWVGHDCTTKYWNGKCPVCKGNCSSDEDCVGSLRCAKRDGFEDVPGCKWGESSNPKALPNGPDYCFKPVLNQGNKVNYIGECGSNTYLCGKCEGDCLVDADCKPGLKCFDRTGFESVPGCSNAGGERDMFAKSICYDVNAPSPTPNSSSKAPSYRSSKEPGQNRRRGRRTAVVSKILQRRGREVLLH